MCVYLTKFNPVYKAHIRGLIAVLISPENTCQEAVQNVTLKAKCNKVYILNTVNDQKYNSFCKRMQIDMYSRMSNNKCHKVD